MSACSTFVAIPTTTSGAAMAMLTVRQIDRADKEWLQKEAARQQLSMEELARRLIHEKRQQSMEQRSPSEIVQRHFGPQGRIDLGERRRFGFDAPTLQDTEAP
jgi:plasmid stability protein